MSRKTFFIYLTLLWLLVLFVAGLIETYRVSLKALVFMKENLLFVLLFVCVLNSIVLAYLAYQAHKVAKKVTPLLQKFGIKAVLLLCLLSLTDCSTPRSYYFARYAVHTGLDIAEEAGAFKERTFTLPTQWRRDTIVFYEGINRYLLIKRDTSYIFTFTPNRKNIQDTTMHFLQKQLKR